MGALDQLYIQGWAGNVFSSEQAARNLIELASGATLGEGAALLACFILAKFILLCVVYSLLPWKVMRRGRGGPGSLLRAPPLAACRFD